MYSFVCTYGNLDKEGGSQGGVHQDCGHVEHNIQQLGRQVATKHPEEPDTFYSVALAMKAASSFETLVTHYPTIRHHVTADYNLDETPL